MRKARRGGLEGRGPRLPAENALRAVRCGSLLILIALTGATLPLSPDSFTHPFHRESFEK